jgi:hypothetical protein
MKNWDLKIALIQSFGSQIVAARRLKIQECKLSYIVNGHSEPNVREREVLKKALGRDYFSEVEESQANERRGVMGILADQTGSVSPEPKQSPERN